MTSAAGESKIQPVQFTAGTEKEVNYLFYHLYGSQNPEKQISISTALQYLYEFKTSNDRAKIDIVICVAKRLCTQYQQYNDYPYDKLIVTAQLLGGMISKEIYPTQLLDLMLGCVTDSLQELPDTKLYMFGLVALNSFRSSLCKYEACAQELLNSSNFIVFPEHLKFYVFLASRSRIPDVELDGPVLPAHIVILPSIVKTPPQFTSRYFP